MSFFRFSMFMFTAVFVRQTFAIEGGQADFAARDQVCTYHLVTRVGDVIGAGSAVSIGPRRLVSWQAPMAVDDFHADRVVVKCGRWAMVLPWDAKRYPKIKRGQLIYIDLPAELPVAEAPLKIAKDRSTLQRVRRAATSYYAAGSGGRRAPEDAEILVLYAKYAPQNIATEAGRIETLNLVRQYFAREDSESRFRSHQALGSLIRNTSFMLELDNLVLRKDPTAVELRHEFFANQNRFRLKSALDLPTAGDLGGAMFARTAEGVDYLMGVINWVPLNSWASSTDWNKQLGESLRKSLRVAMPIHMAPLTLDTPVTRIDYSTCEYDLRSI
jgi:hypothetical protein